MLIIVFLIFILRRKDTSTFYYHIPVPIKDQLVIFCEGNWKSPTSEYTVSLTYKDDEIELGKITNNSRLVEFNKLLKKNWIETFCCPVIKSLVCLFGLLQ